MSSLLRFGQLQFNTVMSDFKFIALGLPGLLGIVILVLMEHRSLTQHQPHILEELGRDKLYFLIDMIYPVITLSPRLTFFLHPLTGKIIELIMRMI